MPSYIITIPRYFGGYVEYTIEATNKAEALEKAKEKGRREGSGNYKTEEAKVRKKIKERKRGNDSFATEQRANK